MRFYKILIDGKPLFELSNENPFAPRISFDLKQFEGSEVPNNIISIYNVGIEFFGVLKKFIGKKFELYAGIKNQTLLNLYGVTEVKNNLIAYGYIAEINANPNYSRTENQVFILLRPSAKVLDTPFLLELKAGDNLKDKLKQALQSIYADCIVDVGGLSVLAKVTEKIKILNFAEVQEVAKKNGIAIGRTTKGFLIDDKESEAIATPRVLKPQDFLEVPSQIRTSTIQASLMLRGDLSLFSFIEIPKEMFATIPLQTNFILAKPEAYIKGRYKIVKIWHIGDSRNKGAQSWATNIEAIAIKEG